MASTIPPFIVLFSFSLIYGTYLLRLFKSYSRPLQDMKVSYSDFNLCDNARFYRLSVTAETRGVYCTVNSKTPASTAVFGCLVTAYGVSNA
jgi:hypothetical protein